MRTATEASLPDRRSLQAIGVLLPIQLHALSFFSGRHPLGRAGDGMRFLRTRNFEPGQDNPRDIDRFSPPGECLVNEWEAEAQASIVVYVDDSASMRFAPKAAVLNHALLQLTYSLWRATDRVRAVFYSADGRERVGERNLRGQMEQLVRRLRDRPVLQGEDPAAVLAAHAQARTRDDLLFLVSDFCPRAGDSASNATDTWRAARRSLACDVIPIVISFELPAGQRGCLRLWDPELQRHRSLLVTPARTARINAAERDRTAQLERLFRGLGIDYAVLRAQQDVYAELARLARWRRRHRK